ncbi:3-hydroxyacyl-CoA dehydrogenase/enoyl-CoA hydratase family protein [Sporomusa malonica]|uniref:3-hydroxyacyl-CoA dehydrogenase n=1 Tax=Sporomusa malonica TaxID=112901 RepID=A0A1W2E786_9FIRM|nr:3-hydroxyacyl-CoA dehydrogenase/enoyl-CoA hydratase family protein [Sporomusa malonica]SMD05525.1 3-hydroxyacyl-CoA dehydrogenase [Sporomusa malonica]
MRSITKVAVIGSGVMGAGIAAHLANAGLKVDLLDIVPSELTAEEQKKGLTLESKVVRDRIVVGAKQRLEKSKPPVFLAANNAKLISVGNLEDDFDRLKAVDWIIEVVIERLDIKQALFKRISEVCKPQAIISSNTSSTSINEMVKDLSLSFRQRFLGTHFFNPPTIMKLLEIIPGDDTLPEISEFIKDFSRRVLGKGVVVAKDEPCFIANRIGMAAMWGGMRAMVDLNMTVEEIDAVTGIPMGRPKSATLRTNDMAGHDLTVLLSESLQKVFTDKADQEAFTVPDLLQKMVQHDMRGDKSGQGFYKRVKNGAQKEILALDYTKMEYRPQQPVSFASLELAAQKRDIKEKMAALVFADDAAGQLAWRLTKETLLYAANNAKDIAYNLTDIDNALKWGYNWVLGPFEIWDALGVKKVAERMESEGVQIPVIVKELLASGRDSFYTETEDGLTCFDPFEVKHKLMQANPGAIILKDISRKATPIKVGKDSSLIDLGDGVACLEFHSRNDVAGEDLAEMLEYSIDEVEKNWAGLVIGHQGKNFCVGANLKTFYKQIEGQEWQAIETDIRAVHKAFLKLKYSPKPVVAAAHGMAFGGGAEILLSSPRVRALADLNIGLVEAQVGLIPGSGGVKEIVTRTMEKLPEDIAVDPLPMLKKAHEKLLMATVYKNAYAAKAMGYFRDTDGISMNKEGLIKEAKDEVLHMSKMGYVPPTPKGIKVTGSIGYGSLLMTTDFMKKAGFITEYSAHIGNKLAYIMTGGNAPNKTIVDEQYLMELELEVFLELVRETKTKERIEHMLEKGKPLVN